jgi:hypothetical protein
MRTLLSAALLLVTIPEAQAKPWFKEWRVWTAVGISIGSSIAATHAAHECRLRFGPAPCDGGYGPFKAREGMRFVTAAGLSAVGVAGARMGFKETMAPSLAFAGYNLRVAVRQGSVGCPAGQEFVYGTKFTCHAKD